MNKGIKLSLPLAAVSNCPNNSLTLFLSRRARIDSQLRVIKQTVESLPVTKHLQQTGLSQLLHDFAVRSIPSWVLRSDLRKIVESSTNKSLLQQTYFEPYPRHLEKVI